MDLYEETVINLERMFEGNVDVIEKDEIHLFIKSKSLEEDDLDEIREYLLGFDKYTYIKSIEIYHDNKSVNLTSFIVRFKCNMGDNVEEENLTEIEKIRIRNNMEDHNHY